MLRKFVGLALAGMLWCLGACAFAQTGRRRCVRGRAAGQTVEKIKMLQPNLYEITGGVERTL